MNYEQICMINVLYSICVNHSNTFATCILESPFRQYVIVQKQYTKCILQPYSEACIQLYLVAHNSRFNHSSSSLYRKFSFQQVQKLRISEMDHIQLLEKQKTIIWSANYVVCLRFGWMKSGRTSSGTEIIGKRKSVKLLTRIKFNATYFFVHRAFSCPSVCFHRSNRI